MRNPPVLFEAEMGFLGAVLSENARIGDADFLRAEHFADPRHQAIYDATARLAAHGVIADAVTLKNHFEASGELESIGGAGYLAKLATSTIPGIVARDYAKAIHDRAMRRRAMGIADALVLNAADINIEVSAEDVIATAQAELSGLLTDTVTTGPLRIGMAAKSALEEAEKAYKRGDGIIGVPTYLDRVDGVLGGLRPGSLIVIGGRPGMGKSDLAVNIALRAARAKKKVVFFQLEMSAEEMAARCMATVSGLPAGDTIRGRVTPESWAALNDARLAMDEWPFYVDASPRLSVAQMIARARTLSPDLVVVDHLTLVPGEMPGQQFRGKVEQTAAVSGALKVMAKTLACPVIALCQLSREVEKREDPRPTMSDLRWAGEIEQDADAILFLYRGEYYLSRTPKEDRDTEWQRLYEKCQGVAEIIIAKNRMGAGMTAKVAYSPAQSRFGDLPDDHPALVEGE